MILSWESNVNFTLFANVLADQLLLKSIDEGVGTDGQRIVLALTALEGLAINKSLEINNSLITISNWSVLNS